MSTKSLTVPTYRTQATVGAVTIKTSLYGPVSPERIAETNAETKRRADMLQPYIPMTDDDLCKRRKAKRDTRRGFRDDYTEDGEFIGEEDYADDI